jgi:hypothetical protein
MKTCDAHGIRRRRLCMGMAALLTPLSAASQTVIWQVLMNRWKQDQYLNIENGPVTASQIKFTWWSAHWNFSAAMMGPFMKQKRGYFIESRWKERHFLHMEGGVLKAGPVEKLTEAAFWSLEPVDDDFVRIRNHEQADAFLQIDASGNASAAPLAPGYWSGHWRRYAVPV